VSIRTYTIICCIILPLIHSRRCTTPSPRNSHESEAFGLQHQDRGSRQHIGLASLSTSKPPRLRAPSYLPIINTQSHRPSLHEHTSSLLITTQQQTPTSLVGPDMVQYPSSIKNYAAMNNCSHAMPNHILTLWCISLTCSESWVSPELCLM